MLLDNHNQRRPDIEYPCEWKYKVIGSDLEKMLNVIDDVSEGLTYDVTPSNISRKGNYYSLNLKVFVPDEEKRNDIYSALENEESVKMVL